MRRASTLRLFSLLVLPLWDHWVFNTRNLRINNSFVLRVFNTNITKTEHFLKIQDDADAEYLCQSLWTDPAIAAELAGRILPWAGDVCRYEAAALCRAVTAGAAKKGWLVIMTMMN